MDLLVSALLQEQHSDLAHLPLTVIDEGCGPSCFALATTSSFESRVAQLGSPHRTGTAVASRASPMLPLPDPCHSCRPPGWCALPGPSPPVSWPRRSGRCSLGPGDGSRDAPNHQAANTKLHQPAPRRSLQPTGARGSCGSCRRRISARNTSAVTMTPWTMRGMCSELAVLTGGSVSPANDARAAARRTSGVGASTGSNLPVTMLLSPRRLMPSGPEGRRRIDRQPSRSPRRLV